MAIIGPTFSGNTFDIFNGPKDVPWGSAVNALGSAALAISFDNHTCMPPPGVDLPPVERIIWDVEDGVRKDSPDCLPFWTEIKSPP